MPTPSRVGGARIGAKEVMTVSVTCEPGSSPPLLPSVFAGTWGAFFALWAASPETLQDIWDWVAGLPLAAEIGMWIAALPWLVGLAVWQSSWATWVQLLVIVVVAVLWTQAFATPPRIQTRPHEPQPGAA